MRTSRLALIFVVVLCLFSLQAEGKRKKKSVDEQRPSEVSAELYCHACRGVVDRILRKIGTSTSEVTIYDIMSDICNKRNYHIYEYPPTDMGKGCVPFIEHHEDLLIKELLKRESNEGLIDKICVDKTKICKGIDWNQKPTFKPQIEVQGVKYDMGPDGNIINNDL